MSEYLEIHDRSKGSGNDLRLDGIRRVLKLLSGDIHRLSVELSGFGPHADTSLQDHFGSGVEDQLTTLHKSLHDLLCRLIACRSGYLQAQLKVFEENTNCRCLKLHIGCGPDQWPGWINIDTYPAPLSMAATWHLPFSDASVSHIFVSRLPEALFFPIEIRQFFMDLRRILVPGGVLEVALGKHTSDRLSLSFSSMQAIYRGWTEGQRFRSHVDCILALFVGEPARSLTRRLLSHSMETSALMHLLWDENFVDIKQSTIAGSQHPDKMSNEQQLVCAHRPFR